MIDHRAYGRDGFAVCQTLVDENRMMEICREADRLWSEALGDLDAPGLHWRDHTSGERRPDRIDPAWSKSPLLAALTADQRMLALAGVQLEDAAVWFKDKLIMKLPGAHGYRVHQDYPYWSRYGAPPEAFVTVMLALDPADTMNGATEYCPGMHHDRLPPPPDDPLDVDPRALEGRDWVAPALKPGDAVVFHSLVPHRSPANLSKMPRRAYFVTYTTPAAARQIAEFEEIEAGDRPAIYGKLSRTG